MRRTSIYAIALLMAWPTLAMSTGYAAGAGTLLDQTEAGVLAQQAKPVEGLPLEYYPRLRWTDDFSVQVDSIEFQGNSRMTEGRLQFAVKGFVGKRVMVDKFSGITSAVSKAYRDAGYRARAYIPEQSFGRGKLVVQIIEVTSP